MAQIIIFIFLLALCIFFLVCAFLSDNRAQEAEERYRRLSASLGQLELDLKFKFEKNDPEFYAGWNLAMGHIRTMVREIKKHA